jgi:hypothetical protein
MTLELKIRLNSVFTLGFVALRYQFIYIFIQQNIRITI